MKRYLLLAFAALFVACVACAQGSIPRPGTTTTKGATKSTTKTGKKQSKPTKGTLNGHEWVDLGLPSGTKWATKSTEEKSRSQTARTIVYEEFGSGWDIPTDDQLGELFRYTTQELYYDSSDHVVADGIIFTGKNGNTIRIEIDLVCDDPELEGSYYFNLGRLDAQQKYWKNMVLVLFPDDGITLLMPFTPGQTFDEDQYFVAFHVMRLKLGEAAAEVYSYFDSSTDTYEYNEFVAERRGNNVAELLRNLWGFDVQYVDVRSASFAEETNNPTRNMELRVRPVINK